MSVSLAVRSPNAPITTGAEAVDMTGMLASWYASKNPLTVKAYQSDLDSFRAWAGMATTPAALEWFVGLPHGVANANALRYRGTLTDAGLASATINRRMAALRSVVQLSRMLGRIDWTLDVTGVKSVGYRNTRGPGVAAVRSLVQTMEQRTDARGRRDLALVCTLFDMGLRRAEAVSLDVAHYDRTAGTLSILGKKRTEREALTVPEPTRAALDAWLVVRGDAAGPLFVNFDRAGKGERLTGRSVARITAAAGTAAGIGAVRPHGLRHASITNALDVMRGDVRQVRKFSRHRDVNTLMIYDDNRTDVGGMIAALVASSIRA